ncbi:MAG: DNA polymerase III subunit alpha, partial [Bacillota bacterium]
MFGILYTQSSYEMLKNTIPQETLIEKAVNGGYDFLALSNSNLHGTHQFFKAMKKTRLKPVLGLEINVALDLETSRFLVFVKDQTGYQNLLKLVMKKQSSEIAFQDLLSLKEGLMFVSLGLSSAIDQHIMKDEQDQAYRYIQQFKALKSFYIGLCLDSFDQEMKVAPILKEMADKAGVLLLPLHQTSYINHEDEEAYEALIKIDSEHNEKIKDANYTFMTKNELIELFQDYPFVFKNLSDFIQSISYTYQPPTFEMPEYPTPEGTPEAYLRSLAIVGLRKRLKKIVNAQEKVYQDRLLYELNVIHNMGFDSYFLIVYDFVRFAKTNGIFVGPGRGSSAGSLVAYCLGITDVDPLTYDLLFERFLNPERITMPDIDMDFPDDKRDIVLQYVKEKYGKHHMVSIVTFGTFALRSSIRDIARVMKIDTSRVNGIIARVIKDDIDETDYEMVRLLKVAKKIEGLPRHTGTHAAGMILAKQDLTESIPLQIGINDFYQSQYEQKDLEELGLLKMDFLGIRNLSIIDEVVTRIQQANPEFQITDIPLDDEKTYHLLERSDTSGIFQLESSGMRAVLRKLKPNSFEDLVAILALYRPGPMDNIDEYISRRNGKSFEYIHQDLKPILKNTYGIIVYQEQIMRIASEFAGYTLAEADILRRGVSKKDRQVLENEEKRFIQKCLEKGHEKSIA